MFVFSTVGIPVITIFLSFFHPQTIQANNVKAFQERRIVRATNRPTIPVISTNSDVQKEIIPTSTSITPTPEITVQPTASPTPTTSVANDKKTFIMNAINQYRASQGLPSVQTNDLTCNFAKIRAQEIASNFNHDGFNQRIQNHTLPYPNYSLITENIAETSNYQDVVTMWKNSPGHAANMRADTPYVCVESYGNYYAYEGWSGAK